MTTDNYTMTYEKYGDVMFIEFTATPAHATVETMDVGDEVGFPGQFVVRYDAQTNDVYGVVIENFSAVDKRLKREEAQRQTKELLKQLLEKIVSILKAGDRHPNLQPA